jgi:hypothetical protein
MAQLVFNGTTYPELNGGRFRCYVKTTRVHSRMADGTLATDEGYSYWCVESGPYDYIANSLKETMLTDIRSSSGYAATILPDDSETPITGTFKCVSLTSPYYLFTKGGASYWSGLSFVLEGVDAID